MIGNEEPIRKSGSEVVFCYAEDPMETRFSIVFWRLKLLSLPFFGKILATVPALKKMPSADGSVAIGQSNQDNNVTWPKLWFWGWTRRLGPLRSILSRVLEPNHSDANSDMTPEGCEKSRCRFQQILGGVSFRSRLGQRNQWYIASSLRDVDWSFAVGRYPDVLGSGIKPKVHNQPPNIDYNVSFLALLLEQASWWTVAVCEVLDSVSKRRRRYRKEESWWRS